MPLLREVSLDELSDLFEAGAAVVAAHDFGVVNFLVISTGEILFTTSDGRAGIVSVH